MKKLCVILSILALLAFAGQALAKTVAPVEAVVTLIEGARYVGRTVTWTNIVTGDTVLPWTNAGYFSSITAQVTGTFAGGTVAVLQGSNDGTHWCTLTDLFGTSQSFTSVPTKIYALEEAPSQITVAVGSGAADSITVQLMAK